MGSLKVGLLVLHISMGGGNRLPLVCSSAHYRIKPLGTALVEVSSEVGAVESMGLKGGTFKT